MGTMTAGEKQEIINEIRKELIEVLRALNGFQRKLQELMK